MNTLLPNVKVTRVANAAATGTTEILGAGVDMAGYDGVMFVAVFGDVADTAVLTLRAQGAVASNFAAPLNLAGVVTFTANATNADNKALMLDVQKPRQRYVRPSVLRVTAGAVVDSIVAIQYGAQHVPTTQDVSVLASRVINDPAAV